MTEPVRAAIYTCVSTREQATENQERDLRQWAARLGLEVTRVYSDITSGARSDRAALADVLADAHHRQFSELLIWALDRLSREGIGPMLRYFDVLRAAGVRVRSLQEPWVDTASPLWELLVAVFAWIAKQERERLRERIRAGQARAKAHGVHLGRRPRTIDLEEVRRRRQAGHSWRHIARSLKIPVRTLRRQFQAWRKPPGELCPPSEPFARGSEGAERQGRT
jgi:DNA invertase Pin-like site-specific DNA recombinase